MKRIIQIALALLFAANLYAQAPYAFKYQSIVRDAAGNAIADQNISFRINVIQGDAAGASVYEETHSATTNQFGLVDLNVGEGSSTQSLADINWSSGPFFLQIETDFSGGTNYQLMGTSQILSVPYALFAKESGNAFSGDYNDLLNTPYIPVNTSDLSNNSGFITNPNDADSDPTNEIQNLTLINDTVLMLSGGNNIVLPFVPGPSIWTKNGDSVYYTGGHVGIGTVSPTNKLVVNSDQNNPVDTAIFAVKNKDGQTIFAVYEEGVRVYVDDNGGVKASGNKGGFAVGGFSQVKGLTNEYLRVTPDSVRVYIDNSNVTGGHTGGFAIASFESLASPNDIMHMSKDNYFIGHESGKNINGGLYNCFMGYQAGRANTTGSNNTAVGYEALYSSDQGNNNIAIGNYAMFSNTGGYRNVGIGPGALALNTTGFDNVAIGNEAIANAVATEGNTAVGAGALATTTSGSSNTAIGQQALYGNSTGASNVAVGRWALYSNTTGQNNVAIGNMAFFNGTNYQNSIAIGYTALPTGSNQVRLGNTSITALYCSGAYAATTASAANLYVNSGGQIMRSTSSKRYKKDISDLEINTSRIYDLRPVSYISISDNSRHFGLIAEEVAEVIPELAEYARECDVIKGSKSEKLIPDAVQYPLLSVLLLKELKKHEETISDQKKQIEELQAKLRAVEEIEARLNTLENALDFRSEK